jgi:hypothetical protein
MSNKVTSRSYSYFLKFSYFNFSRDWFFQLCQKLQSLVKKTQGILGVKPWTLLLLIKYIISTCYLHTSLLPSSSFLPFQQETIPLQHIRLVECSKCLLRMLWYWSINRVIRYLLPSLLPTVVPSSCYSYPLSILCTHPTSTTLFPLQPLYSQFWANRGF